MKLRHPAFKEIIKDVPDADADSWQKHGWEEVVEVRFAKGGVIGTPKRAVSKKAERVLDLEDTQSFDPFLDD